MTNHERRNFLALDECFNYCRLLELKAQPAELYKLCNAIRTLDLALAGQHEDSPVPLSLCNEAWFRVRDSLFNALITSFSGRVEIWTTAGQILEPGEDWPSEGTVEFYPDDINRRNESYRASFDRLLPLATMVLRWCLAENRQQITPEDFIVNQEPPDEATPGETQEILEHLYDVCQEQAREGKKKAHRKWWQLYWEASSCPNKRQRHQLRKQMVALEGIWGKPE